MIARTFHSRLSAGLLCLLGAWQAPALAAPEPVVHRSLQWRGSTVHVLEVLRGSRVHPVAVRPGKTVADWAKSEGAVAAINGGYFNHSDGWAVSHVRREGKDLTDPGANKALLKNPVLKPVLPLILDHRAEWRSVYTGRGQQWRIAFHDAPQQPGDTLKHLLQAGPALLPTRDLVAEGFQVRDARGRVVRDGIASTTRAPRSALGLTAAGDMLWVAVGRPGATITELAGLMTSLRAVTAIALDGGSSTSLTWREGGRVRHFVGSGGAMAQVNSALVVLP